MPASSPTWRASDSEFLTSAPNDVPARPIHCQMQPQRHVVLQFRDLVRRQSPFTRVNGQARPAPSGIYRES